MEIWEDIKEYGGVYKISNLGRVKSLKSKVEKILTQCKAGSGYCVVFLSSGKGKPIYTHRLVAEYFIPNPENKPQVNHINGDKRDNRVENIEWCTIKENYHHATINGLNKRLLESRHNSKITEKDVLEIIKLKETHSPDEIAKIYPIKAHSIRSIFRGDTWSDITGIKKNTKRTIRKESDLEKVFTVHKAA